MFARFWSFIIRKTGGRSVQPCLDDVTISKSYDTLPVYEDSSVPKGYADLVETDDVTGKVLRRWRFPVGCMGGAGRLIYGRDDD
jgi:hypothetical protein